MDTNKKYHEINHYKDSSFPVEIYQVNRYGMLPTGRWLRDYHWHDELQFTFVTNGSITIQVGNKQYCLQKGEGIYISSGLIHAVIDISDDGTYSSLNFPWRILSFFPGSRMEQDFVLPYAAKGNLSAVLLKSDLPWQQEILSQLFQLNHLFVTHKVKRNEYSICVMLVSLWQTLIEHAPSEPDLVPINLTRQQRLQDMLNYIYEHYSEDIKLKEIAATAYISVGECCRIFRNYLQTTPHAFLKHYRIQKSLEYLHSGYSVSETAKAVGYHQTSNFISTFKQIMGCTPAKYFKSHEG